MSVRRVLVTGGVRSGKSRFAEGLLEGESAVTYVAAGPKVDADDADWVARVTAHRSRRPGHWSTVETSDVADVLRTSSDALLVDCLGTWLTAILDEHEVWEAPEVAWRTAVDQRIDDLVVAWGRSEGPVVAVTNEVGMGIIPEHRSGRVFRDLLGTVNQRVAAASDEVALVVAGRVLYL